MADLNKVILIGRLTRDPELRYTGSGTPVTTLGIAVNRRGGTNDQTVDFFDVVAWRKLAELCNQYLGKGRLIAVDGRLQVRSYQTQDGQKRKVYEVVANNIQFLDKGNSVNSDFDRGPISQPVDDTFSNDTSFFNEGDNNFDDDDIPF